HTRFSRDWSSDVCSSDLHSEFVSAPAERSPIQCTMFYRFVMEGAVGYSRLDAFVDETLAHARAGCEENKGLDWLRRAAQAGQPEIGRASCRERVAMWGGG